MQFMQAFQKRGYEALGGNISVGDRYMFLSYCGYPAARYCLYDKQNRTCTNFKNIRLFGAELSNFDLIPLDNGALAAVILAVELCGKTADEESLAGIVETDNPVVVLMKLR